ADPRAAACDPREHSRPRVPPVGRPGAVSLRTCQQTASAQTPQAPAVQVAVPGPGEAPAAVPARAAAPGPAADPDDDPKVPRRCRCPPATVPRTRPTPTARRHHLEAPRRPRPRRHAKH